jgi:isopenicillin-N epimerase
MNESTTVGPRIDVDEDWQVIASQFEVREDTIYLNHGSFGISPRPVREARRSWIDQLDRQPMDFFVRQLEPLFERTLKQLGDFLNTDPHNLIFVENATTGMNIVADSFPLRPGDQILTNNHEYGAVHRIWDRVCQRTGARHLMARLPEVMESVDQVVDALFAAVTDQTRLLVVSHITSPTALIMPVREICRRARLLGIGVCVDGPHAPAHVPLDLTGLDCDFYTASCHKWLCATLGSGFLYVHPRHQDHIQPQVKSWGRLLPNLPEQWYEEFIWPGTRDPSGYLSVGSAIDFMQSVGVPAFQQRVRHLQRQTTRELIGLTGQQPLGRDIETWYGGMSHVPLPAGDWSRLQQQLWQQSGIEVPVIQFEDRWYIRVSHHLYNTRRQIGVLLDSLRQAFA